MSTNTDKKEYPQFSENIAESVNENNAKTFNDLRFSPSVHNRPNEIISFNKNKNSVVFKLSSVARKSVLSYTHETALHLYKPADAVVENLYIHIELWSDDVFRVVFSDSENIKNLYSGLPNDAQMLIAKPNNVNFALNEKDNAFVISTDEIDITVSKSSGKISASDKDGKEYFSQLKTAFKAADVYDLSLSVNGDKQAVFESIELDNDELIYGLGERFDSIVRNGRQIDFRNKDAVGTTSLRSYVNIPFYISTKGYGLFLNSSAPTDWQIATIDLSAVQFAVMDNQIDYFVMNGTPKEIIKKYCTLTGFSKLPPLWSFGLWMSRNSYTSWKVVDKIAEDVRKYDIPCDVLHLDTAWFNEDWNCDLKFSKERFPDPENHIKQLNDKGFNVTLWQYNFIPPRDNNTHYKEAVENGYLAKDKYGKPYKLPKTCRGSWVDDVIVDFSNPKAREWYSAKIKNLMEIGASAMKTDFGEGIPEDAIYENIDGKYFHNLYSLVYNSTVFNASNENIVWARSGTAGSQRFPLHWGGDSQCTFEALAGTLRGALSIGMSGIPFFSHDIGGFIGVPDDELYIRWAQLGLFSSHSRCHGVGDNTHREPWTFSQEACDIFRFYDKLRYSLMPYIYEQAGKCTKTGLPMMRALYLDYPDDKNVWHIDNQYMFGESLLIAPVIKPLSKSKVRNIYLPKCVWFDYFTKEKIESNGMWIKKDIELKTLPIFVKQGAVLKYCSADVNLKKGFDKIVKTEKW